MKPTGKKSGLKSTETVATSNAQQTWVCIDISGSTGGSSSYWSAVHTLAQNEGEGAKFVFWDTSADFVSLNAVYAQCKSKRGRGGTYPECFAKLLPENCSNLKLIIVTDGQIGPSSVSNTQKVIKDRPFHSVVCYFLKTGGTVNLSVTSVFTRNTDFTFFVDGEMMLSGSTDIDLTQYENDPEKFLLESDNLFKLITVKSLGKSDHFLRDELLKLKKNLLFTLSKRASAGDNDKFSEIRKTLTNGDLDSAMQQIKSLVVSTDESPAKLIESTILNMCENCLDGNNFSFGVLKSRRVARAEVKTEVDMDGVAQMETLSADSPTFDCSILWDEDIPVLPVCEGDPVLQDCDVKIIDAVTTNPLLALLHDDIKEKVKKRLDTALGLSALTQMWKDGKKFSPFTRLPLVGCFALGSHQTHSKSTDWALANVFFGKKLVGNPDLWLAVIYFIIKDVPRYQETEGLIDALEKNLRYRLCSHQTNLTLSGLPIEPMMKAPVDVALWYCLITPFAFPNIADARVRLRSFGPVSQYLISLVRLLGYPFQEEETERWLKYWNVFSWMQRSEVDKTDWRNVIRGQYQAWTTVTVGGEQKLILLDGPCKEPAPLPDFLAGYGLSAKELSALSKLVDISKKTGLIYIPNELTLGDELVATTNYGYSKVDRHRDTDPIDFLCPTTFRPWTVDPALKVHWVEAATDAFKCPVEEQLSVYEYFIRFANDNQRYPVDTDDFLYYIATKQTNKLDSKDTLPIHCRAFAESAFARFEHLLGKGFNDVPVETYIATTNASRNRETRVEIEKQ